MATILSIPGPEATEDTAVRFAVPAQENSRGLFRKFVKSTYTLVSGPNSGATVDYVVPEVALAAGTTVSVTPVTPPATAALTNVSNSASSVAVLASNASRKGATIFNDDTITTGATLYLKFGTTASATSYTVAVVAQGYYEVPAGYTGRIDGIASAATGTARVTEIS